MQNNNWNLEHTYTELPPMFFRNQKPEAAPAPQMVVFNHELAKTLGLPEDLQAFAGLTLPPGAKPISQAYAGYQFGHFAMLGDGRAVLLGEQITRDGRRFDIQLKGAGVTPFSRRGDGYAALMPMLREYIISEAMFHLGIPTTRSLAVVLTGKNVMRETVLKGAVLTRVAASHIRVGTFDYVAAYGTHEDVRLLADYSIRRHFPEIDGEDKYLLFLREVIKRQAHLIAQWQLVGFIHGVMNTDNMAISGETIDYGPCAFMDVYDPDTVFSSIDTHGRYAYKNQPGIGAWNLSRLAESLLPLLHEDKDKGVELAQNEISQYLEYYNENWCAGMRLKLGLANSEPEDATLFAELLDLMTRHKLDYTNTFRALAFMEEIPALTPWHKKWLTRLTRQATTATMKDHNPAIIPRNHRVEEALAAADDGDISVMFDLLDVLRQPYEKHEKSRKYSQPYQGRCEYRTFCGT